MRNYKNMKIATPSPTPSATPRSAPRSKGPPASTR